MKKLIVTLGLFGSLLSTAALADNSAIQQTLKQMQVPQAELKISDTPISNLKRVHSPKVQTFYITTDGKYLTPGPIYQVTAKGPVDIENPNNLALVNSVAKDAITYKAANEKYVITVFTDISCHYCQKLHQEINEYNKQGITVRYLAFPRAGVNSEAGKQMQSIWAAKDRKAAFDQGYKTGNVPAAKSSVNYVEQQRKVGVELGVEGTPTIVLSDGSVIGGYLSAGDLKSKLDEHFNN